LAEEICPASVATAVTVSKTHRSGLSKARAGREEKGDRGMGDSCLPEKAGPGDAGFLISGNRDEKGFIA
jgi:hypothetical protein